MSDCIFCQLQREGGDFFYQDDLFMAMWSSSPAVPGHALVMPKRHVQFFRKMDQAEMSRIAFAVAAVKSAIEKMDLAAVYDELKAISEESQKCITTARTTLASYEGRPPIAFNDGINDGPAAGQSVPHLHWHILPRWDKGEGGIIRRFLEHSETL